MADSKVKERHYWIQLQLALTAGQWESPAPAKTPKGVTLSWSELFRKFRKHSHRKDISEATSQTHYLSLLLRSRRVASTSLDGVESLSNGPFELGDECLLLEERKDDASQAFDVLQQLVSSDEVVRVTLAYFAYALGRPDECLKHLSGVTYFERLAKGDDLRPNGHPSEKAIVADHRVLQKTPSEEALWTLLETLRSCCLEGMSHEKLSASPSVALSAYDKGVQLLTTYIIPKSPPTRSGKANFASFTKYRELWRWTERLLWRDIVLSARHRSVSALIPIFRTYSSHSAHWPPNFRASHRTIICSLYLRALIALASYPHSPLYLSKTALTNELRSVVHEHQAILGAVTKFPSAGERNIAVEDFADLCVAVWQSDGSVGDHAAWVLDIMWWATRLTFNCPRIFRHMTGLLHVSGDNDLAKRVLRLYVQVVLKARETSGSSVGDMETGSSAALESDEYWVQTLVQGARMLCRIPGGVEEAKEAQRLVDLARERADGLGDHWEASVDLADGICKSVLALRKHEPSTRGELLSQSLSLITRSLAKDATPSAHFHAALALSRPTPERNLEHAVEHMRHAIEAEPMDVRHWHVLALLEAKLGEWKKAKGVLDAASTIAATLEERATQPDDAIVARDFGASASTENGSSTPRRSSVHAADASALANGNASGHATDGDDALSEPLLSSSDCGIPPSEALLKPVSDHPVLSDQEQFELALQLRMTELALVELVDGQECVENSWLAAFEWYAQRKDMYISRSFRKSLESSQSVEFDGSTPPRQSIDESRQDVILGGSVNNGCSETTEDSQDAPTITSPTRISLDNTGSVPNSPSKRKERVRDRDGEKSKRRSSSQSPTHDTSKGKRVQRILKDHVHKQSARINTISKKIGHGVAKGGEILHRSTSAPDFHAVLTRAGPYQASSIHSRKRVISWGSRSQHSARDRRARSPSPPPPPLPAPAVVQDTANTIRNKRERRLLSDLWVMSAALFRRIGKTDQAVAAIREAELLDEENEAVWVQLGLYYDAMGEEAKAIESLHKALFIAPDDPSAQVHLCRLYLTSASPQLRSTAYGAVDLAAGMLESLTRGAGWDVPEAWYLLAKAYGMQGRKERERQCLVFALGLAEVRGVRDIGTAVGWCL